MEKRGSRKWRMWLSRSWRIPTLTKKTESKYVENTKNVDSNFGKNWTVSSTRTGCRVPQELDGEFGENVDRGTRQ
jgi:hypothetical protein